MIKRWGVFMESIMKKLSEIESAATAIVDHAEAQKAVLDKEYEILRRKFDQDLESQTQARIQAIRQELVGNMTGLLEGQTGTNSDSMAALKEEYNAKHTLYARQILKNITEV